MINVACISDTHDDITWLNDNQIFIAHIVIIAGDIFDTTDYSRVTDSLSQIYRQTTGHVVIVGGNHDLFLWKWRPTFRDRERMHYLEDSSVQILGFNIHGSPWTSQVGKGVFQAGVAQRKQAWDKIPDNTDILVTHSPPKHYRDLVARDRARHHEDPHLGCAHLHERVMQIKPKLHVFGHIHEGAGMVKDKGITFVNASRNDENYLLAHEPTFVQLSKTK